MQSQDKNRKPVVNTPKTQNPIKQYATNRAPVKGPVASKSAFGKDVMPTNGVSLSGSAKLQKASKLSGRAGNSKNFGKLVG